MKGIRNNGRQQVLPPPPQRSAVVAVTMRVAGDVEISVCPDGLDSLCPQVGVRVGDALIYVGQVSVASRVRRGWDALRPLVQRLPRRAGDDAVAPSAGSYPVGVLVRVTETASVGGHWVSAAQSGRDAFVRIRLDRLVLEVCDQVAYARIGAVLLAAERYLRS